MRTKMKTKVIAMIMVLMMVWALTPISYATISPPWDQDRMVMAYFYDDDDSILYVCHVPDGWTPTYEGETPTKPSDAYYTYTFAGWDPEIGPVVGPAFYHATYTATEKKDPSFEVKVNDINYGEDETIKATITDAATGSFNVKVKDSKGNERNETVEFEKGEATIVLQDLPEGECAVTAVYSGNEEYKMATKETTFVVHPVPIVDWTSGDSLPSEPGSYRLTEDVDLDFGYWSVPAGKTSLYLNGKNITAGYDDKGTIVLHAEEGQRCTLSIYDDNTGESAGTITNTEEDGIRLETGSTTLNMYGGKIADCDDYGVKLDGEGASFNMYNGEISGCWSGVCQSYRTSSNMFDGKISDCTEEGVRVYSEGEFTLHNGEIKGNKKGVKAVGTFRMKGGTITGNDQGVELAGTFLMENGTITGNLEGVTTYVDTKGIIFQGGEISPVIIDNKNGENNPRNLCLNRDAGLKIKVSDGTAFGDNTALGITATKAGEFTENLDGKISGGKTIWAIFSSDDPNYCLRNGVEGGAALEEVQAEQDTNLMGCVDVINDCKDGSIAVHGWVFDSKKTDKSIDVLVYIGGEPDTIEAERHDGIVADKERTDVNKVYNCGDNHGFTAIIPTNKRGKQKVLVYADPGSGQVGQLQDYFIGEKTITISDPTTDPIVDPTKDPTKDPTVDPTKKKIVEKRDLPAVKIKKVKAGKKSVTVKWKKPKKKIRKKIQGYEIQYSMDGFKTIAGTKYVKKNKKSVKIKGLKSKTKYQIRIRAYKNDTNVKHVSKWKKKKVKVK